jgi:hypothetical protein
MARAFNKKVKLRNLKEGDLVLKELNDVRTLVVPLPSLFSRE